MEDMVDDVIKIGTIGAVKDVKFVALTKTKSGGACKACGWYIAAHQPIFKYVGPGWVCYWCSVDAETHEVDPEWLVS